MAGLPGVAQCNVGSVRNISDGNEGGFDLRKWFPQLLNIALRMATLASRFLLVFFLAKLITPSELGLYGILTATIGYSLYLVGLDFYTFTTRELIKFDRQSWGKVFKNQVALALVLYVLVLPLLSLVFINGYLPWSLAIWFYVLIVLEHINQEMFRLFIALSDQLYASILLFFRQGTWAIGITIFMLINPAVRNLDSLLIAWVLSGIVTVFLGFFRIYKLRVGGWKESIDWTWIIRGLKISLPFLVATLALRGIFTLDRYWLQSLANLEVVGAYVLFISLGLTMITFLDAGVFTFSYPTLIKAYQKKQPVLFRKKMREMLIQTTAFSIVFSGVSLLVMPYLLVLIDNPIYFKYQSMYVWLLVMAALNAFSMIPHYGLYAQNLDRPIMQAHAMGFGAFVASVFVFSNYSQIYAIPIGLCVAFAVILFWKTLAYFHFTPRTTGSIVAKL